MKPKILLSVSFILIVTIVLSAFPFWDSKEVAKVSFPLGNVLVLPNGQKKMEKAGFNQSLYNGDKIKTDKGARCEIKYKDGSVVRIAELSIYTIEQAEIQESKKEVSSFLSIGQLWANIKKLTHSSDSWLVRGPSAVVAVRGTVYRMDANADSSSKVLVYDGSVNVGPPQWRPGGSGAQGRAPGGKPQQVQGPQQVKGPHQVSLKEWVEIVKAQQQIIVKPDGSYQKSDFNLAVDSQSDWVRWNQERDKLLK